MSDFFSLGYHRRLLRSTLGWRIALAVFAAIAAIEVVVLVPSAQHYRDERRERLAYAAERAVAAQLRAISDSRSGKAERASALLRRGSAVALATAGAERLVGAAVARSA